MKEWICEEVPATRLNGEVISTMLHQKRELVRCKDCKRQYNELKCPCGGYRPDDWFCANGEAKE